MEIWLLLLVHASVVFSSKNPHIIGGTDSAKGRWPWQLSLQYSDDGVTNFQHTCGASVLSEEWVLTAAHCLLRTDEPEYYRVQAGAFRISPESDAEQTLKISQVYEHPDFDVLPGLPYDIAILKTTGKFNVSNPNIQAVSLPKDDSSFTDAPNCWISGWGRNDVDAEGASPTLKELNIPVVNRTFCNKRWGDHIIGWLHPVDGTHICVGDAAGKLSACQGDSGGPLSCPQEQGRWVVAGVASRADPLCQEIPAVYTRVASYNDWIRNITGLS